MVRIFLIALFFQCSFIHSQCIEKEKIKYGGDWAEGSLWLCPAYTFSFNGNTSKKWDILNGKIDISQVESFVLPIKKLVEKQIKEYAGDLFFSKLKFYDVTIAYRDSIKKFKYRYPRVHKRKCKSKYFFYYKFAADSQATYNIGIAADKTGKIISPMLFPKKTEYPVIDTSLTVCRIVKLAKQVNKEIEPIKEIKFEFDTETKKFYWLISQEVPLKEGKIIFNQVIIDAADSTKTETKKGETYVIIN